MSDSVTLKKHVNEKHTETSVESMFTKETEMECFICGQKGASEDELERHMQAVHIDQVQTLLSIKTRELGHSAIRFSSTT